MDNDMNTVTAQQTAEPTMADLQAQIADLQQKLSQPIQTTTVKDGLKVAGIFSAIGMTLFVIGTIFFISHITSSGLL